MADSSKEAYIARINAIIQAKGSPDLKITNNTQTFYVHQQVVCPQSMAITNTCAYPQYISTPALTLHKADSVDITRLIEFLYPTAWLRPNLPGVTPNTIDPSNQITHKWDVPKYNDNAFLTENQKSRRCYYLCNDEEYSECDIKARIETNIKMFYLADYLGLRRLKILAASRVESQLKAHWSIRGIKDIVGQVFSNRSPGCDMLLCHVNAQVCAEHIYGIMKDARWVQLLKESSDIAAAIMMVVNRNHGKQVKAKTTIGSLPALVTLGAMPRSTRGRSKEVLGYLNFL